MIANFKFILPSKLEELKQKPQLIENFLYPDDDSIFNDHIDIDKAWEGIHFLLTGSNWEGGEPPLAYVVMGGVAIGDDIGYGPARYIEAQKVKEIYDAFKDITEEDLKNRFDPEKIKKAEIYPFASSCSNEDFDYLLGHFRSLKDFYKKTVEQGNAMLQYLN
ncbi:MAG: YfbM family protein [Patescibacteria group bacterium]|nr:YfbM family protein [Patescibacteria group bacterium]